MFGLFRRKFLSCIMAGSLSSLFLGASATNIDEGRDQIAGMQLPVWTEDLGEVPLEKYTREELDKMVSDFWTPERIKNAVPMDPLRVDEEALKNFLHARHGFARQWEPEIMLSEPILPQAQNRYIPYATPITNKGTANGKIYFYDPHARVERYCSGAAMNSSSKRIVATAAHCIHGGPGKTWRTNVRFIPNYHVGSQPNGEFYWSEYNGYNGYYAWMPQDWIDYGEIKTGVNAYRGYNSDFVFITTNNNNWGQRVIDSVGGHGLWTYNGGPMFDASIFGYPQNINGGEIMQACWGTTQSATGGVYNFSLMGGCNFGGGSSGGPWLDWYNNATGIGQLRSVTSFGPEDNSFIVGPLFHSYIVVPLFNYANIDSSW